MEAPPAGWKPVEVLTKSAPAAWAARQQATISSSLRTADSIMTLSPAGPHASRTARTSASTSPHLPSLTRPRLTTMSTSWAPLATASAASAALTTAGWAPEGKPQTVTTRSPAGTVSGSWLGLTHTE